MDNDYHKKNMRHLFVELPYYTAEFLNQWMKSDNDDILNMIFFDCEGVQMHSPNVFMFYKKIKSACPDTIFHGTDIGHQYSSTGVRYLQYLKDNNLKGSLQYSLTQQDIAQGKFYYGHNDNVYRENKMAKNFIREYDNLHGENIMGIYGAAHTGLNSLDYETNSVPCMANQLKKRYGNAIHSEDLSNLTSEDSGSSAPENAGSSAKNTKPDRVDIIKVDHKEYKASHFGKQDISAYSNFYTFLEFWRLESAYNDFKNDPKTENVLPYSDYPMPIKIRQVFVVDITTKDGSVIRFYFRSDGRVCNGLPSTEEFVP